MAAESKDIAVTKAIIDVNKQLSELRDEKKPSAISAEAIKELQNRLLELVNGERAEIVDAGSTVFGGGRLSKDHSKRQGMAYLLLGTVPDGRMEVYLAVQSGFTLRNVQRMVNSCDVYRRAGVLTKIVGTSERTLARRMQEPDQPLTPDQSTRALHYAEAMEKASEVLGSKELAERWISQPARGLDGLAPIDLIPNAIGYELVDNLLARMDYGVY